MPFPHLSLLLLLLLLVLLTTPIHALPQQPVPLNLTQTSLRSKQTTNHLVLVSRSPATLFLNGLRLARLSRPGKTAVRLPTPLQKHDILTIVAKHRTSRPGVMLMGHAVNSNTKWRAQYVLKDALTNKAWTKVLRYNPVCKWRPVRIIDPVGQKGASFIWPKGNNPSHHLARFRFVVGGRDNVHCRKLAQKHDMPLITVAATDRAWVFVNGYHVMDVLSKSQVAKKKYPLKKGDVVAIKAMDIVEKSGDDKGSVTIPHEFGFVIDIHYRGRHITTRPNKGPWRVTAMYKTPDPAQQFAFMRNKFNDCNWGFPVSPKRPPRVRAIPFPYSKGARYVWADNAQRHSKIVFARTIIDGDEKRCESFGGQGLGGGPRTCACQEVPSAERSVCHYFVDSRQKICNNRRCEPKYECTTEAKSSLICIKRYITHRIVPIDGTDKCRLHPDEHFIYVPYHRD